MFLPLRKHASSLIPLLAIGGSLVAIECTENNPRAPVNTTPISAPATTVVVPAQSSASPPAVITTANPANTIDGSITGFELFADGSLGVSSDREVVVVDPSGAFHRHPIAQGQAARLDSMGHGTAVVIESGTKMDEHVMLSVPALQEIFSGPSSRLQRPTDAVATRGPSATVIAQIGSSISKFSLPGNLSKTVESLDVAPTKKYAVVTYSIESTDASLGAIFEVASGKLIGKAPPISSFSPAGRALIVGDLMYGVEKDNVVITDLSNGTARRAKLQCTQLGQAGNPMLSPKKDLLLATCGEDGFALDPKTLGVKKRFTRMMPGCDNGDILPAHFEPKVENELIVEGCGGIAKLDLSTGKYKCTDSDGLVGAPYEMVPLPHGGGGGGGGHSQPVRRIPADRQGLPRCSATDAQMPYLLPSASNSWQMKSDADVPTLVGPKGETIKLEASAPVPTLSTDETRLAYQLTDRVILRAVPAGNIILEIVQRETSPALKRPKPASSKPKPKRVDQGF
jgi:hypothetical protein